MNWESRWSEAAKACHASDIRELLKLTARPDMISFAGGLPDPTLFPIAEFKVAADQVLSKYGQQALQYSTTEGLKELRLMLVDMLQAEGIALPDGIDSVILTTGSQQALQLLGQLLINPGDTVLVEAPSYLGALQAFDLGRPRYESIEMDGDGLRMDALETKLLELRREGIQPKFLYTIPTFQNPTGATMSLARRQSLIILAEKYDLLVIEDDPYGRLRFRGEVLPSLKSMDKSGRVLALRTFSKTLTPGLRTGYVVGDPAILRQLVILKQAADLCSPALTQFIIVEMLNSGAMERYVQKAAAVYRTKEETMAAALKTGLAGLPVSWNEPDGGMFFWVTLPEGSDSQALLYRAIEEGVAYVKGAAFYPGGAGGHNTLRLNFSNPTLAQIETGIARLSRIVANSLELVAR